jgi:hypothetical protein
LILKNEHVLHKLENNSKTAWPARQPPCTNNGAQPHLWPSNYDCRYFAMPTASSLPFPPRFHRQPQRHTALKRVCRAKDAPLFASPLNSTLCSAPLLHAPCRHCTPLTGRASHRKTAPKHFLIIACPIREARQLLRCIRELPAARSVHNRTPH